MKNNSQTSEDNRDSGVLSHPLSFLRSGYFYWGRAGLYGRGNNGYYWSLRSLSTTSSNYLNFYSTGLNPQDNDNRGSGFAVRYIASGGLAPDSICPKGWQLPTYSGDKSFTTLINTSYSMKNSESEQYDVGVLSSPLSLLRSGSSNYDNADLNYRGNRGIYWSLRSANTTNSSNLGFDDTVLNPQGSNNHGYGFAVRCELHSLLLNS